MGAAQRLPATTSWKQATAKVAWVLHALNDLSVPPPDTRQRSFLLLPYAEQDPHRLIMVAKRFTLFPYPWMIAADVVLYQFTWTTYLPWWCIESSALPIFSSVFDYCTIVAARKAVQCTLFTFVQILLIAGKIGSTTGLKDWVSFSSFA